jgi:hypothetical protein
MIPRRPPRIVDIPRSPGDQMNVTVHDGLSGISADVDPYVVSVRLKALMIPTLMISALS